MLSTAWVNDEDKHGRAQCSSTLPSLASCYKDKAESSGKEITRVSIITRNFCRIPSWNDPMSAFSSLLPSLIVLLSLICQWKHAICSYADTTNPCPSRGQQRKTKPPIHEMWSPWLTEDMTRSVSSYPELATAIIVMEACFQWPTAEFRVTASLMTSLFNDDCDALNVQFISFTPMHSMPLIMQLTNISLSL